MKVACEYYNRQHAYLVLCRGMREAGLGSASVNADWSRKALYRGLAPSLIRAVPAAAATFLGFEATKGELPIPLKAPRYGRADYA